MKHFGLLSLMLSALVASSAFAKGTTHAKKSKKAAVSEDSIPNPQVLEKKDNTIGLRGNMGGAFEGEATVGVNYERMITSKIGVGGTFGYTNYNVNASVPGYTAEWDYTVYTFIGEGSLHADLFKVKNLDTYATLGLGHSFIQSEWKAPASIGPIGSATASTTFIVAYANARYFFNPQWAATASIGTGIGLFGIGLDYLWR